MRIALGDSTHTHRILSFFNRNLDRTNNWVYSEEFFCTLGMKAAIKREQMIVAIEKDQVVGALRFYRKKTANLISLYQFSIHKDYREQGYFKKC